jgi:SAM-dependent methyltransferase
MKNQDRWKASKFVYKNGKLTATRDANEVGIGSRLIANIVAKLYDAALHTHAKGKLLDLGCGKVPFYLAYKDLTTESTCVDWINTLHTNEYLDFELDLTKPLPFLDNEFDTIILSDVLEHIPVPEQLLSEIARILASNGKIIMNVPFLYWIHERPHDYYRYTEFALLRFVDISGLTLIELKPIGGVPEILADIISKNVISLPVFGDKLAVLTQLMASWFINTDYGRRMSESSSRNFPLGYFLIAKKP